MDGLSRDRKWELAARNLVQASAVARQRRARIETGGAQRRATKRTALSALASRQMKTDQSREIIILSFVVPSSLNHLISRPAATELAWEGKASER